MNVSVVIVTHNRPHHIKTCISSILANTRRPEEIIVVDDSDVGKDSARMVRDIVHLESITMVYRRIKKHRGVSFSRNIGIKLSTGDIIAFIDDDCKACPDWVSSIVKSHKEHNKADAITGHVFPVHPQNYWNQVLYRFHFDKSDKPKQTVFLFGANYSLKRRVFDRGGFFFNERMIHCSEDRYISYILRKNNRFLLYDPRIKVMHEFRTSLRQVYKQWLRYGISDYYFWKLTPGYQENPDSDYFRRKATVGTILVALPRSIRGIFWTLRALKVWPSEARLIPGVVFIFIVYYLGLYRALCEDTWPDMVNKLSSDDLLA